MAAIKSFTDLSQSKVLAEFLPLESADAFYASDLGVIIVEPYITVLNGEINIPACDGAVPCWSLVALLGVLPKKIEIEGQCYAPCLFPAGNKWLLKLWYNSNYILTSPIAVFSDNPVDSCVDAIKVLHELNLL